MVMPGVLLGVCVLLLAAAAALTASLAALFRISDSQVRIMQDEGFAGASELAALRGDAGRASALGVLRALCIIGAAAAGVAGSNLVWGPGGLWAGAPAAVLLVVLLGEIAPRAAADRRPVRIALATAPFLRSTAGVVAAVLFPLLAVGRLLGRVSGSEEGGRDDPDEHEQGVREALRIGTDAGIVEDDESLLVERAFKLDDLNAWDAMTPRVDIVALPDSRPVGEALPELEAMPHSRFPVYGESIDDVTGILHVRDAYRAHVAGRRDVPLGELAREPLFVPGSLSLSKLLARFQAQHVHMGIVADEFGGTDGLITLEDVLEELVGEIVDETDLDEDTVTEVASDVIIAQGGADVREINERFGFGLQAGEHRSVNGFILEELGQVPETGRSFRADDVLIEVMEATDTQVLRARLTRSARE